MQGWIVGRKSDESLVEVLIKRPEWTQAQLESVIPTNYGGVSGDYSYYEISESDVVNYRDGQEWEAVWVANEIDSIDFSVETDKRWIRFTSDVTEFDADGVDEVEVTAEIWKADQTGIDTAVTGTMKIPVITPDRVVRMVKFSVVAGVLTRTFKTVKAGMWTIPAVDKRFDAGPAKLRVYNRTQLHLQAFDVTSFS